MKSRLVQLQTNTIDEEEFDKITEQINTLNEMINEYEAYKAGTLDIPYGSFQRVYSPAVSSIVAYFNSNDFYLAAELLTHTKDNDVVDSFYSPSYGYLVKQTTIVYKELLLTLYIMLSRQELLCLLDLQYP